MDDATPSTDGPTEQRAGGSKWLKPKSRSTRPAPTPIPEAEKIRLITHLDRREQIWGYVFAGLTVALAITVYLIGHRVLRDPAYLAYHGQCAIDYKRVAESTAKTGPTAYVCVLNAMSASGLATQLILQLGMAAVIAFVAYRGKRSQLTFALFLCALTFGTSSTTFALLFMAYGAYLLIRSNRLQKETGGRVAQANRMRAEREARKAGQPSPTTQAADRPVPAPSKRYTPKAAAKRRGQSS